MVEERIGIVKHYYPKARAAELEVEDVVLSVGDRIRIRGHGHDFVQTVESIEVDHAPRAAAHPGEHFAIRVREPVHERDDVFLIRQLGGPME